MSAFDDYLQNIGAEPLRNANEYERADHERDLRKHDNSPFGRQPLPVTLKITGGESVDRYDMFTKLNRMFLNDAGNMDFSVEKDFIDVRYYPRAVND